MNHISSTEFLTSPKNCVHSANSLDGIHICMYMYMHKYNIYQHITIKKMLSHKGVTIWWWPKVQNYEGISKQIMKNVQKLILHGIRSDNTTKVYSHVYLAMQCISSCPWRASLLIKHQNILYIYIIFWSIGIYSGCTPNDHSQEVSVWLSFVLMLTECPEVMVIQFDQICGRERSLISDTSLQSS